MQIAIEQAEQWHGILFIKGLVLRQINLEGTAPAWVSAPSLILIVINEMGEILFSILPENILSLCLIPHC